MTVRFNHLSNNYGVAPQSARACHRDLEAVQRKHDALLRTAFWCSAIAVGLLFWGAVAYGVSLLSLKVLAG